MRTFDVLSGACACPCLPLLKRHARVFARDGHAMLLRGRTGKVAPALRGTAVGVDMPCTCPRPLHPARRVGSQLFCFHTGVGLHAYVDPFEKITQSWRSSSLRRGARAARAWRRHVGHAQAMGGVGPQRARTRRVSAGPRGRGRGRSVSRAPAARTRTRGCTR